MRLGRNVSLSTVFKRHRHAAAAFLCVATMVLALPFRDRVDIANIDMLFLLAVFLSAVWLGRGPAVMAVLLSVALFDFFFVPPYLSFAVADAQYLITFAVMLTVGLLTSHLVAQLAERTAQAQESERQARLAHALSRDLGLAMHVDQVADITAAFLDEFDLNCTLMTYANAALRAMGNSSLASLEMGFAQSAYEHNTVIEVDTLAGASKMIAFLPLTVSDRVLGVLAVGPRHDDAGRVRELRPFLEAAAAQIALIVEHLAQADAIRESELQASEERLRTSILASLSHDMRTPLTSLVGLADALAQQKSPSAQIITDTAAEIRDQALGMHHMLANLLEMARLQGRDLHLNKEWQPIDEVIGSSIRLLAGALSGRPLEIRIPEGLPLVHFDAVLIERVICNLLENAIKYSRSGTPIQLEVALQPDRLDVAVKNQGTGFPAGSCDAVFELFVRGDPESTAGGTGIGLAICQAIIVAHNGQIAAENIPDGACVHFSLPLSTPPALAEESAP